MHFPSDSSSNKETRSENHAPRLTTPEEGLPGSQVQAVLFDVDGTLYHKSWLRLVMTFHLLWAMLVHPGRTSTDTDIRSYKPHTRGFEVEVYETALAGQGKGNSIHPKS